MIVGIDEAGRGPVIGPMVICAFFVSQNNISNIMEIFETLKIKDSKKLTSKGRERIFREFQKLRDEKIVNYETIVISPQEIDSALESKSLNLNKLEIIKSIELLLKIFEKYSENFEVFIDCPSNNIKNFIDEFSYFFNQEYSLIEQKKDEIKIVLNFDKVVSITFAHKADEKYKIVSAASIVAKVTRDKIIEELKQDINFDFGSGYPADPKTREFLEKNYDKYDFFRKSWDSWKREAERHTTRENQQSLKDFFSN